MLRLTLFTIFISTTLVNQEQGNSTQCEKLPAEFISYIDAFNRVNAVTNFLIKESINTSSSSWIRGASYFSCNGRTGFLIFKTDSKNYIHQDVPLTIWNEFKSAGSFGQYWNAHLKNKYRLKII